MKRNSYLTQASSAHRLFIAIGGLFLGGLTLFAQTTSWRGTTSTSWGTAANWTAGVPTASLDAIIGDANFTGANQPALVGSSACKSLTIGTGNKACTLSVNEALAVSGNIVIGTNGTISHGGNTTISLTGNWTNSGTYVNTGPSTRNSAVAFAGSVQSINGATTFKVLSVSAASTLTLNNAISVTRRLTVSGTLDPRESPTFSIAGAATLTVNAGGRILVKASTFAGNYALTGAITLSAGSIVEYAAASASQTISSSLVYSTLRVSGNGTRTLANNLPALNSSSATVGNVDLVSGTLDLSTFTANRGTTVGGGTFTIGNGATLKIGGTNSFPANYATRSFQGASTVEYSGTNQTVPPETYGNLKLSSSGGSVVKTMPTVPFTILGSLASAVGSGSSVVFTASSVMTVSGSITIGPGTTFDGGSFSHSLGGNWTNNGTFNGGAGTIIMNGPNGILTGSGGGSFNNLVCAKSGIALTAGESIVVAGNFSTTGVGSFTHLPGGSGSVAMSGAGKVIGGLGFSFNHLAIPGSVSTADSFSVRGNLTVNGSLAASAGTLTLSGVGAKIQGGGTVAFNGLNISGSLTTTNSFSVTANVSISGSFTATSGTANFAGTSTFSGSANLFNVTLNGSRLQLGGSAVLGIANSFSHLAGTFDVTTSSPNTVSYNGAAQTILAAAYDNLTLAGSGIKSAGGSLTINRDVTISPGATFSAGAFTHSLARHWINSGSFNPGTGAIVLMGGLDSIHL